MQHCCCGYFTARLLTMNSQQSGRFHCQEYWNEKVRESLVLGKWEPRNEFPIMHQNVV